MNECSLVSLSETIPLVVAVHCIGSLLLRVSYSSSSSISLYLFLNDKNVNNNKANSFFILSMKETKFKSNSAQPNTFKLSPTLTIHRSETVD